MKQKVQAGILSEITNTIKAISEIFFKFIDKFDDYGIEITKKEDLDNEAIKLWCKYNDVPFGMIYSPILDEENKKTDKVNVLVRCNNKDHKLKNIKDIDVESKVIEILEKEIGLNKEDSDSVQTAHKLRVTLQKVTSAKSVAINLTSVNANFDSIGANKLLNTVLDNDEFLNVVTEEPTSFEITDQGDEVSIQSIDSFDIAETFNDLVSSAMELWGVLCTISWNAHGKDMGEIRSIADCWRYDLQSEIDEFGRLAVEFGAFAKNPCYTIKTDHCVESNISYDSVETVISSIYDLMGAYIESLELYYPNFPHDVQNSIDRNIRNWKERRDYYFKQRLK